MSFPELSFQMETSFYFLNMLKGRRVPFDLYVLAVAKKDSVMIRYY